MAKDGRVEGVPRIVDDRHVGGFIVRLGLTRKDGDMNFRFNANKSLGDTPSLEELEELERKETGCQDAEVHAVEVYFGFNEVRYHCSKAPKPVA